MYVYNPSEYLHFYLVYIQLTLQLVMIYLFLCLISCVCACVLSDLGMLTVDGRLPQIELAYKAANRGGLIIGARSENVSILMAYSPKRSILGASRIAKLHKISGYVSFYL